MKRLGVHCSLVQRDRSAVADEILGGWLARFGKGREIFDSPGSVEIDDRPDEADSISPADMPANL